MKRGATLILALTLAGNAVPRSASAATGGPTKTGWSFADSKAGDGAELLARYASEPSFVGTGNGTMSYPVVPALLYTWATASERVAVETISVTAVNATTWNVSGSVSGGHPQATTGVAYAMNNGVTFTIGAGATPFVAGDAFSFELAPHIDATKVKTAKVWPMVDGGQVALGSNTAGLSGFQIQLFGGANSVIAYSAGYAVVSNTGDPRSGRDYPLAFLGDNVTLPARGLNANNTRSVAAFWDELKVKPTSRILSAVVGTPGSRMFVVQWVDFAHQGDPTASYTFQLMFFENSPRVRVHYLSMTNGTGSFADGSSATIGVQPQPNSNFNGTQYRGTVQAGVGIEFGEDLDADGLPVGLELSYGTNPNNRFTDAGVPALSDSAQFIGNLNPTLAADNVGQAIDGDTDGLPDLEERVIGLNPASTDSDSDGVLDNVELASSTDALRADTDNDGVSDGMEDLDKDGSVDVGELDPRSWDTDLDGLDDGLERQLSLDPLDPASTRFSTAVTFPALGGQLAQQGVVDSKGNMHVAVYASGSGNSNDTPNDLWIALYSPSGTTFASSVDATNITSHLGYDDRQPTVVTVPGSAAVDKTLIFNGTRRGHAFLTEVDLNLAARDGSASDSATVVTRTSYIPLSLSVQHPHMKLGADGNLHVVFVGSPLLGSSRGFSGNRVPRGIYYMRLDQTGGVLVPPTELYKRQPPSHPHMNPRIELDAQGRVHGVFRAGSCNWTAGPSGCNIYYFKMTAEGAVTVPATMLATVGSGGIDKAPSIAVSPNGNVNIVWASTAPVVGMSSGQGGNTHGRGVYLHVLSSVGNQLTTLVDQKLLIEPKVPVFATSQRVPNYVIPAVGVDAGGNLHVYSAETNSSDVGTYHVFDPSGSLEVGPILVRGGQNHDQQLPSVQVVGTRAYLSYVGSDVGVTTFDFDGLGLDQTGGAQVPPPVLTLSVSAITPARTDPATTLLVAITGSGFLEGSQATIGGVALTNVQRYDATTLIGTLDVSTLADGPYDVVVSAPDAADATLTGGFYVGTPPVTGGGDDGCGCRVGGGERAPTGFALAGLAVLLGVVVLRRRRR